jgi:hypothetical protein
MVTFVFCYPKFVAKYIKEGSGDKIYRRIFFNVPLDKYEEAKIKELEKEIKANRINLPSE